MRICARWWDPSRAACGPCWSSRMTAATGTAPPFTSKMNKAKLPTHIELSAGQYPMMKDSVILLEQLRTIDKKRLRDRVCHLEYEMMQSVDEALRVSLDLHT